jgi:hypothetical protein
VFDDDGPGPNPPALYAGGFFGATSQRTVVRWNGSSWTTIGTPFNFVVNSLVAFDADGPGPGLPELYAAGGFTSPVAYIARWTGTQWLQVGSGLDNSINAMAVFDDDGPGPNPESLYICSSYLTVGGSFIGGVGRWTGTTFQALGAGLNGGVNSLFVLDEDGPGPRPASLIAGGDFPYAPAPSPNIARWDGTAWRAMGSGIAAHTFAGTTFDPDGPGPAASRLIVVGDFTSTLSTPPQHAPRIAQWDGAAWAPFGPSTDNGVSAPISSLALFDPDGPGPSPMALFAAGQFTIAGNQPISRLASWNGHSWSALPGGSPDNTVSALLVFDDDDSGPNPPALYAGGDFTHVGAASANHIARWDGAAWSALGSGFSMPVRAMIAFDPDGAGPAPATLFAGGGFPSQGFTARWNGSSWTSTFGFDNEILCFAVYDPDDAGPLPPSLYAGGRFRFFNSIVYNGIARWTGSTWAPVAGGVTSTVNDMAVYDPDGPGPTLPSLYVGGILFNAGSPPIIVNGLARWNGTAWSSVPGNLSGFVGALRVYDADGPGPALPTLLAAGSISVHPIGGPTISGLLSFNGATWSSVAPGLTLGRGSILPFDDDGPGPLPESLYIGGDFTLVNGRSSSYIARWGCPPTCYANCDLSTLPPVLNVNDFICFLNSFAAGQSYANCDQSTLPPILNVNDFTCFMNRYAAGCP